MSWRIELSRPAVETLRTLPRREQKAVARRIRDLEEAGPDVQFDVRAIREDYLDEVRRFLKAIEIGCGRMSIDYVPLSTAVHFDDALSQYLAGRRGTTR